MTICDGIIKEKRERWSPGCLLGGNNSQFSHFLWTEVEVRLFFARMYSTVLITVSFVLWVGYDKGIAGDLLCRPNRFGGKFWTLDYPRFWYDRILFVGIPKGSLNYCLGLSAVETKCCLDKFLHRWSPEVGYGKGRNLPSYFTAPCCNNTILHLAVVKDIREPAPYLQNLVRGCRKSSRACSASKDSIVPLMLGDM